MKSKYFDVIVAKEYESKQENGNTEKRTAWNKVGRAWKSQTSDCLSFELHLIPNQRYVINLKGIEESPTQSVPVLDVVPF